MAANVEPEVRSFLGGPQRSCADIPISDSGPWLPALGVLAGAEVVPATASVCLVGCADGRLTHRSDDSQGWDAPRLSCMVLAGGCALVALDIASAQASGPAVGEHPCGARSSVCNEYRARARYVWCSALLSVWTMCV